MVINQRKLAAHRASKGPNAGATGANRRNNGNTDERDPEKELNEEKTQFPDKNRLSPDLFHI